MTGNLPIAVIGAGPIGLAAAAHLASRGLQPVVFEQGATVGTSLQAWRHVRVFSPWSLNIDAAAQSLLLKAGWAPPQPDGLPTGREIVDRYLTPLARLPGIAPNLKFNARVTSIRRSSPSGDTVAEPPFSISWTDKDGLRHRTRAAAVLDASGTWDNPSPIGVDGRPISGEAAAGQKIDYGIPDVLGCDRHRYAGQEILVIGGGHSAINIVLDILNLPQSDAAARLRWALRSDGIERLLSGELNARLPARAALGRAAQTAIDDGKVEVMAPFRADAIRIDGGRLTVEAHCGGHPGQFAVDRIAVATGLRPDLSTLQSLNLDMDERVGAPRKLAPLIDPAVHSCGSVPPHGISHLRHPERGFFIVGSKSYGRAPTFLLLTGYEQVRSVVASLAGDHEAAEDIRLTLPSPDAHIPSGASAQT